MSVRHWGTVLVLGLSIGCQSFFASSEGTDTAEQGGASGQGGQFSGGNAGSVAAPDGGPAGTGGSAGGSGGTAGTSGGSGGTAGTSGGSGGTAGTSGGKGGSASAGAAGAGACKEEMITLSSVKDHFQMEPFEVTRCQYEAWLKTQPTAQSIAGCQWKTSFVPSCEHCKWPPTPDERNLPVVGVDWCDAKAYCTAQGARLCSKFGGNGVPAPYDTPTDASTSEWYYACSQNGTLVYPYGMGFDPAACNGDGKEGGHVKPRSADGQCVNDMGYGGIADLSGNVWEWENSCENKGTGDSSEKCRVRGGAFDSSENELACTSSRTLSKNTRADNIGIRCCSNL